MTAIKMYGGGMNDLKNQLINDFKSPFEIELLFNNQKLELFQYLIILYSCLKDNRKRKLSIEQLLYYYTIIFSDNDNSKTPLIFKYTRDQSRINDVLIKLGSIGYIEVSGEISMPTKSLKISITKQGITFIEHIESISITDYINHIRSIISLRPYEKKSIYFKKLLYEGNYSYEDK